MTMYVDLLFLLLIYVFSAIALIVSIYTLWTLREIQHDIKRKQVTKRLESLVAPIKNSKASINHSWPPR